MHFILNQQHLNLHLQQLPSAAYCRKHFPTHSSMPAHTHRLTCLVNNFPIFGSVVSTLHIVLAVFISSWTSSLALTDCIIMSKMLQPASQDASKTFTLMQRYILVSHTLQHSHTCPHTHINFTVNLSLEAALLIYPVILSSPQAGSNKLGNVHGEFPRFCLYGNV